MAESGLADFFEHVEILAEKSATSYQRVLDRLGVEPDQFVMVGNSVRSDVLPVLEIGARAVHIPYGITWVHEDVDTADHEITWHLADGLADLPALLAEIS